MEVHDELDVEKALKAKAKTIGINNRDLQTFKTSITTTLNLRKLIPEDIVLISESGISSFEHIFALNSIGVNGVLIGEHFMVSDSIYKAARRLRGDI